MMRYRIRILYDGTAYCGWQVQKNGVSIQSIIQKKINTILPSPTDLTGSGRTDAGVHATGQIAHFDSELFLDPKRFIFSLNSLLPSDIRITALDQVEDNFHARYSAKRKIYHYHLFLDPILDPFQKEYTHQVMGKFDLELLSKAAPLFVGEKDFCSFANVKDTKIEDTKRCLYRLDIIPQKGGVRLEFEGNGFLYKMVRNIVGTLIDVAQKRIPIEKIPAIFDTRDRRAAGQTAPAKGLFLVDVIYSNGEK